MYNKLRRPKYSYACIIKSVSWSFYPAPLSPCWIFPNVLSFSYQLISEMLFLISIRWEISYGKTPNISVISVNVSAPARQTLDIYLLDNMDLTHVVTPHTTQEFSGPTWKLCSLCWWICQLSAYLGQQFDQKHGKAWCFQQSFSLRFGFCSKLNFKVNIRIRASTHRNTCTPKMETRFSWTLLRWPAKFHTGLTAHSLDASSCVP